ncbi:uncharacterized protein LOC144658764 [Oculina patagonica]
MKLIVAFLLFASATAEIHNWVGLPEARFEKLDQLLEDEPFFAKRLGSPSTADLSILLDSNEVNDHGDEEHGEGSGVNPGPDPTKGAVHDIVEALHVIIPAIKDLKEARDKQNREYARKFVDTLRRADEDDVKRVFGAHIMALHKTCVDIKLAFARHAHVTGLFDLIKTDDLDFTVLMGHVIAAAEEKSFDIFAVFSLIVHSKELHNHPGVKAIMTIGQMVVDAACDVKLDGLLDKVVEIIENEDEHGDFDFKDKIIPYLYQKNSKKCPGGLMEYLRPQQSTSMKARLLSIIFEKCKEVRFIRFTVSTVMDAIKLGQKVEVIKKVEERRVKDMMKDVTTFMESNMTKEAQTAVGDYVLTNLRRALIVGLAVKKQLESFGPGSRPSPSGGPRPSGSPKPSEGPKPSSSPKPSEVPSPSSSPTPSKGPEAFDGPNSYESPKPTGGRAFLAELSDLLQSEEDFWEK